MTMVPRRQVTTGHTVDASSIIRSIAWKTGLVKRTTNMINWLGPRFKRSEIVWFILYPPYWWLPHPHVFPTWIILFQNCQSPKHLQVSVWEFKSPLYNSWSPSLSHKCQHMMGKILWWKYIHWGKSLKTQFLKFFSFLRRVSIESPTASKMSQAKTISHKVFPIPHYLTTWPPDYLTIWRLFDYLVTGWSELQPCKARGSSDYPGDWLTPCLLCHQYNICTLCVFAHLNVR